MGFSRLLILSISILPGLIAAFPAQLQRRATITADVIQAIAPQSASCDGAPKPAECRTAQQATPHIINAFKTYKITTAGEMAALVSLMAYESGDFKYQNNYFPAPGNPGQGTRNMQSAAFNVQYAQSIPALGVGNGASASSMSATQLNEIRAGVTAVDDYDFGSAAWFLTTQCSDSIRTQLQTGSEAGWAAYMTQCVGATQDTMSGRQAVWAVAATQLGLASG